MKNYQQSHQQSLHLLIIQSHQKNTLASEVSFAADTSNKVTTSVVKTSYRRKVEENPTLLLELCVSKKPYTALGTVVGAQSSKLSTLPVNKLIVLYVVFKLDESYTPSKVSIRAGDGFHNLKEIKTVELVKATGWVYLSLSGADPR
ncbi:hypothetical protein JHK85_019225 [Glycine max]|nr:hypothetical protein JHK85_019225 [Glycine max]